MFCSLFFYFKTTALSGHKAIVHCSETEGHIYKDLAIDNGKLPKESSDLISSHLSVLAWKASANML